MFVSEKPGTSGLFYLLNPDHRHILFASINIPSNKTKAMNFLNQKTTWRNYEFAVFKIAVVCFGLLAGSVFHDLVSRYQTILLIALLASSLITLILWIYKMRKQNS